MINHGDSLDVLLAVWDEQFDAVITSPPYVNFRTYEWECEWDFETFKWIAQQMVRTLKEWWVIVWIVGDATINGSETGTSFKQALYFKELGLNIHDTMIWRKPHFSNPSSNRYHQTFEYMFIFSKGKPKTFNPIKDLPIKYGKPKWKTSLRNKDWTIKNGDFKGQINEFSMRHNVWDCNTTGQENFWKKIEHPATFPKKIIRDHILTWTNEEDLVLDPFAWSWTVGIVAKELNREYFLIEKVEKYFEMCVSSI